MYVFDSRVIPEPERAFYSAQATTLMLKEGGDPVSTYALAGRLVASSSGWLMLEVPNALVRGAFSALDEQGVELPPSDKGLNAHISVMRPDEIARIGGIDKVTERGQRFYYQTGPIKEVQPGGWKEMSKVWFMTIRSPDLERLRKSYGLSALPNEGKYEFHVTIAVRRKGVLQPNEIRKAAAMDSLLTLIGLDKEAKSFNPATSFSHALVYSAADAGQTITDQLMSAKAESQRRNYAAKQDILRKLLTQYPEQFNVRPHGRMLSIRHKPSRFSIHMAPSALPSLYHRPQRTMKNVVDDAYNRIAAHAAQSSGLATTPDMQDALGG